MAITKMQETKTRVGYGRWVITRIWHNRDGQLHRTTGPAWELWTVLPSGAHVPSYQCWWENGELHREGRPARRSWHVADDGTSVLQFEVWWRNGRWHRVGGPSVREWTVEPDGTRTLTLEAWCVNGKLYRVDGPAVEHPGLFLHDSRVKSEDMPWLRRGQSFLVALAAFTLCSDGGGGGSGVSPAWSQDARVVVTWHGGGAEDAVVAVYRSAVGGSVLLCM